MREHIVEVHILKVYTNITLLLTWRLQIWHKGNCTASAHHQSLWQTPQCESHPVRGAPAVGASLRDFPLTRRRNTQIQMYWLWKWLESYNNCTFSTWKDKFLFNLLFWIPNSFCTFHDYARGGTPFLAFPDGPSLIFYHSDFWTGAELGGARGGQLPPKSFAWPPQNFQVSFWKSCTDHWQLSLLQNWPLQWHPQMKMSGSAPVFEQLSFTEKQSCPETFHSDEIFFIFQDFWATCGLPWKTECTLNSLYWIYIFQIIQNFEQLALALKNRACPENFHCIEITIFEELALALKTEFFWNISLYWI